ncbi:hypothetical protein EKO29_04495 [Colwellia sp. Arc7-635]|uniref:hypothetical protein n=1 Tax=Colwellia sp. Arc7-635 TaxID=2497879 RepID=UPI000F859CF4|nr:hypothetical protein [Colwellia sp. Arc7-635]AZQ83375.1 hypothetical protein EKO29_04495 [Colwellia sp. Arc7-635]
MESKIKIKMGPIEIEYEGSEGFLKEELPALLSAVSDLYKASGVIENPPIQEQTSQVKPVVPVSVENGDTFQGTTGSLAAILGVKSGLDLIMAAAGRLTLSLGQSTFTRSQISTEMKSASAYHKKTYMNNLTKYLNQLVKSQKLLETAKDTYALSASEKSNMESRIA